MGEEKEERGGEDTSEMKGKKKDVTKLAPKELIVMVQMGT